MQDTQEIWKPIPGFENSYQASNFGNIKSLSRPIYYKSGNYRMSKEIVLAKTIFGGQYYGVTLSENNKKRKHHLHRFIAETWIPNPENLPCVNHIDGNKLNNRIDNLEWCTYSHNNIHAYTTGLKVPYERCGAKNPKSVLTDELVGEIRSLKLCGFTCPEIAKKLNLNKNTVYDVFVGKSWRHIN